MIDASIYQNVRPVEVPSMLDSQTKAMNLSSMTLDRARAANQMQRENQAYNQSEQKRKLLAIGTAVENITSLPPEQQGPAYKLARGQLIQNGSISPQDAPEDLDQQHVSMIHSQLMNNPEYVQLKTAQAALTAAKLNPEDQKLAREEKRSVIAKNLGEAAKARGEGAGKPLAAEQSDKLAGHDSSLKMIGDLRSAIDANKSNFGPVAGRWSSANPYNTSGQGVSAMFNKAAQVIGKSLEGGKLTDMDIARYRSMLPNQNDTPEVAYEKLDQVERMVQNQRNSEIDTYGKAGSNVSKFAQTNTRNINVTTPKGNDVSGFGMNSANAGNGMPPRAGAGAIVSVGGKHYRVGEDGDSLTPVKGKAK